MTPPKGKLPDQFRLHKGQWLVVLPDGRKTIIESDGNMILDFTKYKLAYALPPKR